MLGMIGRWIGFGKEGTGLDLLLDVFQTSGGTISGWCPVLEWGEGQKCESLDVHNFALFWGPPFYREAFHQQPMHAGH